MPRPYLPRNNAGPRPLLVVLLAVLLTAAAMLAALRWPWLLVALPLFLDVLAALRDRQDE